jgi:hypothetical protein
MKVAGKKTGAKFQRFRDPDTSLSKPGMIVLMKAFLMS